MRVYYVTVTMIGLGIASLGAWLVVSLLNEFGVPGGERDQPAAVARPAAIEAEQPLNQAPPPEAEAAQPAGGSVAVAEGEEEEGGEGRAGETGFGKEPGRLVPQEPAAPPPIVLPQEAGPYRAAFIREPPSEAEFPVIRLGEAIWRVENGGDGSVTGSLDIVAAEEAQRAVLSLAGGVAPDGQVVFLMTLALGEGEFMPDAEVVTIEAITARGRGDRTIRIPATTLPYENPRVIDFRIPAEEMLATFNFAAWFDFGLRIDGALYTITIQNGRDTRDILSAVAYGV
jgi:hypothetical protein